MKVSFPKYVYDNKGTALLVKTPEAFEALDHSKYAESPAHFDADGNKTDVPETEEVDEVPVPGVTPGAGAAYPKWLYHPDGRAQIFTREQHEALPVAHEWREDKNFSEAMAANKVDAPSDAGESLWETPTADVLQMIEGSTLEELRKTRDLETRNTAYPGGRRGLLRELDEMIEAAEEKIAKDVN